MGVPGSSFAKDSVDAYLVTEEVAADVFVAVSGTWSTPDVWTEEGSGVVTTKTRF